MKTRVECLKEASEWLVRLQDPERTEAELNDWLRWCDEDPGHYAAFETAQRRWGELDALKSTLNPAMVAARPVTAGVRRRKTFGLATGVAAALALVVAAATLHFQRAPPSSPEPMAATLTNRSATLPDGSRMILGTQSVVNMDFNDRARQLDLSSGKAWFQVRKDPARPFIVQAGTLRITAIGTAFDVRRERGATVVTVEEGVVQVSSHAAGKTSATWRAEAGYQLTYSDRRRTASLASIDASTALSWQRGELSYLHETLGTVVEDLNRYSSRKIVIGDPEVARLRFTGTVFAAELEGWIKGVEQAYPVVAEENAAGTITLNARR